MTKPRPTVRSSAVEYVVGTEADHEAIYHALVNIFHGLDREAFLAELAEPDERATDRLLAKRDGRVISHLRLARRRIRCGPMAINAIDVQALGTLPEFRGQGHAQRLLEMARRRAKEEKVPILTLSTSAPRLFMKHGWVTCGRTSRLEIASRDLPARGDGLIEAKGGSWVARPWRHVELGDLMRLYESQFARVTGSVVRSEETWRWLINRRLAHAVWVAGQGDSVHGYAFVRDHRVLELATDPAQPAALSCLLGRIRAEAMERAYPRIALFTPEGHPCWESLKVYNDLGAQGSSARDLATLMCLVPDAGLFLEQSLPALIARAEGAKLDLGFLVDGERFQITTEGKAAKVEPNKSGRRRISITPSGFVQLALGVAGVDDLAEMSGLSGTPQALEVARKLFPKDGTFYRSPLDAGIA